MCLSGDDRHAQGDRGAFAGSGESVGGGEFVPRGFQADLKSLDLAEPAVDAGLLDAVTEVADDLFQTSALLWIDAEHRTPHAGFSELHQLGGGLFGTYCQVTTSTEAGRGNGIISHPKGQFGSRCSAASISRRRGTRNVHHRAPRSGRSGHGIVARR